jgi:hypothetical protein
MSSSGDAAGAAFGRASVPEFALPTESQWQPEALYGEGAPSSPADAAGASPQAVYGGDDDDGGGGAGSGAGLGGRAPSAAAARPPPRSLLGRIFSLRGAGRRMDHADERRPPPRPAHAAGLSPDARISLNYSSRRALDAAPDPLEALSARGEHAFTDSVGTFLGTRARPLLPVPSGQFRAQRVGEREWVSVPVARGASAEGFSVDGGGGGGGGDADGAPRAQARTPQAALLEGHVPALAEHVAAALGAGAVPATPNAAALLRKQPSKTLVRTPPTPPRDLLQEKMYAADAVRSVKPLSAVNVRGRAG